MPEILRRRGYDMRILTIIALLSLPAVPTAAQRGTAPQQDDPIRTLVEQLDLEKYKATIKGLTQFGDRRAGSDRNRAAIDWIETQLKSYGCANTERLKYEYPLQGVRGTGAAGGRIRGTRARTGVNNDPNAQPDLRLRQLNSGPAPNGPREEVYCTKIGSTHPEEMYIVSAHLDGIGYGEAANDDGSGTAIVMELARILHSPGVQTERSIRFILWNNEESGLEGSRAYAAQRRDLQGRENPAGSGRYPEPKWLGVIQHDMMMFDHGMPRADGTVSKEQRPEADVNVEFQANSAFATQSQTMAWALEAANATYATDYPVTVGAHMQSTDSASFQEYVAAVSVRENERGAQIGGGWNPHWHQPTDVFATFSDADFRLGLNAAQTTLAAIGKLAGVKIAN
jgi:Peptidase family M28